MHKEELLAVLILMITLGITLSGKLFVDKLVQRHILRNLLVVTPMGKATVIKQGKNSLYMLKFGKEYYLVKGVRK